MRNRSSITTYSDVQDPQANEPPEGSGEKPKNPAAVALGRLGGKKGGPARAAKLSASRRKAIARKAAKARWSKKSETLAVETSDEPESDDG